MKATKEVRNDADHIRAILQTIRKRQDPHWRKGDSRTMELLLARALGAEPLAEGQSGDMVLLGTIELPDAGPVRYIIDAKMDTSGRGQAETKHTGMESKLQDLIGEGELVVHATLWVNVNGRVAKAGLFRFYEGFGTRRWRAMEPLTEVSDMNDLARPPKLALFRAAVLARLGRTDLKSYQQHMAEVGQRFAEGGIADAILGYQVVAKKVGDERAERERRRAARELLGVGDSKEGAVRLLGARDAEEGATKLLGARNAEEGAAKLLGAKDAEEAAARLLGVSLEELRRRFAEGKP